MGRILPAFSQFFDDEGAPVANGWLRFLVSSTNNTDKDTFNDENYQIANANPLQLDAAGRCPSVFGLGDYRIVSYLYNPADPSTPGEQLQVFDPVTAQDSIVGGGGAGAVFDEWDPLVEYTVGSIVQQNLIIYRSLIVSNLGFSPEIETTRWEKIDFLRYWNEAVYYSIGEMVYSDDNLFLSLQDLNQNNAPATNPDWWRQVATGYKAFTASAITYAVLISDRDSVLVLDATAIADATFTLPIMSSTTDRFRVACLNLSDYVLTIDTSGTSGLWLSATDSIDITKGCLIELIYDANSDDWMIIGNVGPALGGQDIGTSANPVNEVYISGGLTLSGGATIAETTFSGDVHLGDNIHLYLGDSDDFSLVHDGSNSIIDTATGRLDFSIASIVMWSIDAAGSLLPENGLRDIGALADRVDAIYSTDVNSTNVTADNFYGGVFNVGAAGSIYELSSNVIIESNVDIIFTPGGGAAWWIDTLGHILPFATKAYDLGSTGLLLRHIYQGDSSVHYFGDSQDFSITFNGSNGVINCTGGNLYLSCSVGGLGGEIHFQTAGGDRWFISAVGDLVPVLANSYNIGSATNEIHHIYQATAGNHYFDSSQTYYITSAGAALNLVGPGALDLDMGGVIYIRSGGVSRWQFNASGHFVPAIDNTYTIGETGNCPLAVFYHSLVSCSDIRLKTDINHSIGLDFISQLDTVSYRYNDSIPKMDSHKKRYGLLAQQVQDIADKIGIEFSGVHYDEKEDQYGLDYIQFIGPIIKSIQELKEIVDDQTEKLRDISFREPDNK